MNRTKIEWCDWTWNPITGCKQGCSYCYARRLARRFDRSFEPAFHWDRIGDDELAQPKRGDKVFVGSMGEVFGPWIMPAWVALILTKTLKRPDVTFIFLTKFPGEMSMYRFPANCWIGTTVTCKHETYRIDKLMRCDARIRFVSYEPLLDSCHAYGGLDWQIIGPLTSPLRQPKREWLDTLLLPPCPPTFMKRKLDYEPHLEQWPEEAPHDE